MHVSRISSKADKGSSDLKAAQLDMHDNLANSELQCKVVELRKSVNFLKAERQFLEQQAKCNSIKNSDGCSKFFHTLVKRNSKRNFIAAVTREDGSFTSSQQQVADEFL